MQAEFRVFGNDGDLRVNSVERKILLTVSDVPLRAGSKLIALLEELADSFKKAMEAEVPAAKG